MTLLHSSVIIYAQNEYFVCEVVQVALRSKEEEDEGEVGQGELPQRLSTCRCHRCSIELLLNFCGGREKQVQKCTVPEDRKSKVT